MFLVVLPQVACMLGYMLCGWALARAGRARAAHTRTLAAFLVYVCTPGMIINAFQGTAYDANDFRLICLFFAVTLGAQLLMMLLVRLLTRLWKENARARLLPLAAVTGNVGFLGLPLVSALFPASPIVACYSIAYSTGMNLLMFTVGAGLLTNDRRHISLRGALLNPTTLSVAVALPLYLLRVRLPRAVMEPVALLGRMTTPLCMFVLGLRLAASDLRALLRPPFTWAACGLKLVAFPLLAWGCSRLIPGLDAAFTGSVLALSAMPAAALLLSLAELYGCEQEQSAGILLVSTLLSVVTIPLMMLLL